MEEQSYYHPVRKDSAFLAFSIDFSSFWTGSQFESVVGKVHVVELDWKQREQCATLKPPFDYVIAADCVYHEHHLKDLRDTILELVDTKSKGAFLQFPLHHLWILLSFEL